MNNPIPPRLQWDENNGYCGEVALVSAGLYFGEFLSQYDTREIAGNDEPQYDQSAQLLLGVNDASTATKMHLSYSQWTPGKHPTARDFLAWVKGEVAKGYPVLIGLYTNEYLFYGSTKPNAGDPNYDHIVIVTGVRSAHALTWPPAYYPSDVLTFSDNGLWTGTANGRPQYTFSYPFGSFQANREQANAENGSIYSLPDAVRDYGIAITGVIDESHETVPVHVATSVNYESPQIVNGSDTRPSPMAMTVTVTVSGLHAGTEYHLYRYDSASSVPNGSFNAHKSAASNVWSFTAAGTTYELVQSIESDDEVIYRAVPASAS